MKLLNRRYFNLPDLLVLAAIILIGLTKLPQPFCGDQSLFKLMALTISRGEIMYRDLWDCKPPGIHGFYYIGGSLFGFDEVGVHTFELAYMVAFSAVLQLTMKEQFKSRAVASLIPLLTVGIYYAVVTPWLQTQIEALVGFPIFLSLWFAGRSLESTRNRALWLFLSGVAGGIAVLFKFVFLPIPAVFWLAALLYSASRKQEPLPALLLRFSLPLLLGALFPFLAMVGYFVQHDILDLAIWTLIEYPALAVKGLPLSLDRLFEGLAWYIKDLSPIMALGFVGVCSVPNIRKNYIFLNLALWLIAGLGVILLQSTSWWAYHYQLLLVPLGLLAANGLDVLWGHIDESESACTPKRVRIIAVIALLVLFLPNISNLADHGQMLARHGFALEKHDRLKYHAAVHPKHETILREVDFLLRPTSLEGNIYVFGEPLYYHLSGRDPAIPLLASWFTMLPEQWTHMLESLERARPPYIFVKTGVFEEIRRETTPEIDPYIENTIPIIEKYYYVLRSSDAGTWYALRE